MGIVGQLLSLQQVMHFVLLVAPTAVGNALTSFVAPLPELVSSHEAAFSPAFGNWGSVKEVGRYAEPATVTWQPECSRQDYSKTAHAPCLVCLSAPFSLPRLFSEARHSSGRVGAAAGHMRKALTFLWRQATLMWKKKKKRERQKKNPKPPKYQSTLLAPKKEP